jgi:hypothetical protein
VNGYYVPCDECHGDQAARCRKCGGSNSVWMPTSSQRTIGGALIFWGAVAIVFGLLVLWIFRGFK